MNKKQVIVLGAGFSGLSAASSLQKKGYEVTLLEKNDSPGGRARVFQSHGFTFDMGPSWYWMPDVFDTYFESFGKQTSDYYQLKRLDPSYTVIFGENDFVDIPTSTQDINRLFESWEKGSSKKLDQFLRQAAYKYQVGIQDLVYRPGRSVFEYADTKLMADVLRLDVFTSMSKHIRKFFKHEKIIKLMEFPVLFLGSTPEKIPALYSLMNYADMSLGTWYPDGGMFKIVDGMVSLAEELGVKIVYGAQAESFEFTGSAISGVKTPKGIFHADLVVSSADYHHTETALLPKPKQSYSDTYWDSRILAPSCLLYYVGVNKKLENLNHHNLFFDEDFGQHAKEIYENPKWPSRPLFYVSAPSKTDPTVAPEGHENLFLLIPVAPGLEDTDEVKEQYFHKIMDRLEKLTGQSIRESIVFKRSYAYRDFVSDYHSFKGNAYGLANTLSQTAILKPSLKSKKVSNLYYTGQLTVPGPGVPPSLISGMVVANEIEKEFPISP